MSLQNKHDNGGYTWKSIPVCDFGVEWKAIVSQVDADNIIVDNLSKEKFNICQEGMFSPQSEGCISDWVHNTTIEYLESHHLVKPVNCLLSMCSGGYLFFDFRNTTIRKGIIEPYCQCSYTKKCMSPNGSSRKNHRQDQAMLSVLIHNLNLHYSANKSILFSAKFHKESLSITIKFLRKKYLYQIKNQVGSFYLPSF